MKSILFSLALFTFLLTVCSQSSASQVCGRPDGAVFIQPDFCICTNGQTETPSNLGCHEFCADKRNKDATLFIQTEVGPEIKFHPRLGNLYNWCSVDLPGSVAPQCFLEVHDGYSPQYLNVSFNSNNPFSIESNVFTQKCKNGVLATLIMLLNWAVGDQRFII